MLRDARVSDPPFVNSASGITLGENVAACEAGSLGPPMLCPAARGGTGLGGRYTLAAVHDRGGPFDGYFYVATAPLTVERLGILNYWFLPGAPAFVLNQPNFWDYNQSHPVVVGGVSRNVDLLGLRSAMSAHEGMGRPGGLATGHSGRLQAWVWDEEGDPRRALERMFGSQREDAAGPDRPRACDHLVRAHAWRRGTRCRSSGRARSGSTTAQTAFGARRI